ncbi:MAG: glycine cleavage system protein GcvH [Verrucomicrobia bacterium]|nr:glycine cleavage system protein GcvH [Verrucomicrobiota bacterium]
MNIPTDLRYAPTHEWLRTADGTVGISDHAQAELSDVVYVDLPKVGRSVSAGESVAVVESVKAASDIYAPVSGEIVAVNETLASNAAAVNTDPYGAGWLFRLKVTDPVEAEKLLAPDAYQKQIGG